MLKFINYQLGNEQTQNELEQKISPLIQQTVQLNLKAFQTFNPQILEIIQQHNVEKHSIFCTNSGQLNIVDIITGRVIYSATPEQEIQQEVEDFVRQAPVIFLDETCQGGDAEPLPAVIDVLMVFGFGLGYHIVPLLQSARIKYLIIYEPELDNIACSVQSTDWQQIFELAAATGTQLSFQFGNAGASIAEDIQELLYIVPDLQKIYLYRHLCHPVSDEIIAFLHQNTGKPEELQRKSRQFRGFNMATDYVAEHPKNILGFQPLSTVLQTEHTTLFSRNMLAFAKLYPELHQLLSVYQPTAWLLAQDNDGLDNLYHKDRRIFLYQDLLEDSEKLVKQYLAEPFKDDVIVGQAASDKLASYIHFKYIKKLRDFFLALKSEKHPLPVAVDSLIVFGVALGKHIELLYQQRDITNLYVCEPNLDFFYASVFVTDWSAILLDAENNNKRIYFNIGGDGAEYFNDFMGQFYQVGAYAIANTYMFPAYYTPELYSAINSLRRQLKVVLTMGEFYDHARFGIGHSYLSIEAGHQFLKAELPQESYKLSAGLPVFIIGNGPSLDTSIDFIKQYRSHVVVISCGTAIRSLYKQGVQPDFHAEVEQNRANYDWITQIDDASYLKQINLLSVNGVHPDTASLFGQTYLAFKDGEASTQIFRKGMTEQGFSIASLSYAYPTVSNLAINYAIKLGFKTMYLFGIDLGYADITRHHSKHSAYYNQSGKEIINYEQHYGSGFPVKGNFRSFVYTKPEFDVSRQLIEKVLADIPNKVEVYNCSDGAFIKGTAPLDPANIIIQQKDDAASICEKICKLAYYKKGNKYCARQILADYDLSLLAASIDRWCDLIDVKVSGYQQAKDLIDKQWKLLIDESSDKENIIFYLFYGSSNYFFSILTKMLPWDNSEKDLERFNHVLKLWRCYLLDAKDDFIKNPVKQDAVSSGLNFS